MCAHVKRLAAPRKWAIPRKTEIWVTRTMPGPHAFDSSLPLLVVVRDKLGLCDTAAEARYIIGQRKILVDGKVVTNYKHPVGLMDVVSIEGMKDNYRVLLDKRGKLKLVSITKEEAAWKLVRIHNKTTVKGGAIQLNLHDGRNIILKKNQYKSGDVLKIELGTQKILGVYPFEKGNIAMLIGGSHVGELAAINELKITKSTMPNVVSFEDFSTTHEHVFVVGTKTPEVSLPEEEAI